MVGTDCYAGGSPEWAYIFWRVYHRMAELEDATPEEKASYLAEVRAIEEARGWGMPPLVLDGPTPYNSGPAEFRAMIREAKRGLAVNRGGPYEGLWQLEVDKGESGLESAKEWYSLRHATDQR